MKLRSLVVGCIVCLGALGSASSALGAVSTSNVAVTSPHGTYLIDDQVTPNQTITGTGTSSGTTGDHVDVNCYWGTSSEHLITNVAVNADGTFSFSGSLSHIADTTCVLRAVPAGSPTDYPPGSASTFSGPTLAVSSVRNEIVPSGPNAGTLEYYDLYHSQLRGAADYFSLGGCALASSYVLNPVTLARSETLDYCDAWFWYQNGGSGAATPTRSELQVDGADAFLAGNANQISTTIPGYPVMRYSYAIDPGSGNLVLNETDQVVKCSPGGAYPPTGSSCTSFVPTGVQASMRITQGAGGRVVSVTQFFSSADGHAHGVDMLQDNEFRHTAHDGALNFPWTGSGMRSYPTIGQVIPGPSGQGPGSFFIKGSAAAPDGNETYPQGSATFSNPPDHITVISPTNTSNAYSWFELHYARTVPASGSVALGFTYSSAFLASEVAGYAAAAEAAYRPSVAISSAKASKGGVVVAGTANDATGISGVTVNGRAATLASGGSWHATVRLAKGTHKLSAVATNVFGNTATSAVKLPAISKAKQSHKRWHRKQGTTFSFKLSEKAVVTFTFMRKRGHHTLNAGKLTFNAKAGKDKRKFNGLLGHHKKLKPGKYTVVITAASGNATSAPLKLTFTIL